MSNPLLSVGAHLAGCRFKESAALFDAVSPDEESARRFRALAVFGQRLLRLDLVDVMLVDEPELAPLLPEDLTSRARQLSFPSTADARDRGALESTPVLFGHVLEAFDIRWGRGDRLQVVSLMHLVAEYAGHLAWHSTLGHGGDPLRLAVHVDVGGSRWGQVDAADCGHGRHHRHLAKRIVERDMAKSPEAWSEFLRAEYSRVGEQLIVCATRRTLRSWGTRARVCDAPCPVWTALDADAAARVETGVRLAVWLRNSPAVELRHGAPVGHFFGVPDREEVEESWAKLARQLARREQVVLRGDGLNDQLRDLCGHIAGRPVPATTLIADTIAAMTAIVDGD